MRWYLSFGYDFKKMGLVFNFGDEVKDDLVGWGYDVAPVLRSVTIRILFFEFIVGNLMILPE